MRPQFTRQAARPLTPKARAAAARILRRTADALEEGDVPATAREKEALSKLLASLTHVVRSLKKRHDLARQEGESRG